jgi:signal transduction histidine kinase
MTDPLETMKHVSRRDRVEAMFAVPGVGGSRPRGPAAHAPASAPIAFDALFRHSPLPQWVLTVDLIVQRHNLRAGLLLPTLGAGRALAEGLPLSADRLRLAALRGRPSTPSPLCNLTLADGPEGPWRRGDLHLAHVTAGAEPCMLVTFVDRTADLNREVALENALAQAIQASAAKTHFLAALGHELRTPLHAVISMAQLLTAHQPQGASGARDARFMQVILDAGRHMDQLLAGFLDLQTAELGQLQVRSEVFDLGEVLRDAVAMTAHRFVGKRAVLHAIIPATELWVRADAGRCRQVAINLLDNAAKYTLAGPPVTLSVVRDGQGWRVEVRDVGHGLSEEQQHNLFQPFQRLGAEHTHTPGLGMGLALSRQCVDLMHGRIGCRSAPGAGSTFWFWLPAPEPAAPAPR